MPLRIEDYGIIGDCETSALVGKDGSIDWLCWPDFDSEACFAALLGDEKDGRWKLAPTKPPVKSSRRYLEHTLVLETTFENDEGAVRILDFMPIRGANSDVVRIVEGLHGNVSVRSELCLRFSYGRTVPWVTKIENGIRAIAGPDLVVLRSPIEMHGEKMTTVAEFVVKPGERVSFTMTYGDSYHADPRPIDAEVSLRETEEFWRKWAAKLKYEGPYAAAVERSLITLKAMTYKPTGGVVAAMTTSLPEALGGPRNWDYRYCWLRDTTFTLLALMNGGYYEEARAWHEWLLRALAGSPDQVQIMYSITGSRTLIEWEANWLAGYEGSTPVRIGNAASEQLQLDIYGEVLDATFHAFHGMHRHREEDFSLMSSLVNHLETIWQQPDQGIWESRSGPQQFTYSKMMAWVAFDRAIRLAEHFSYEAPLEQWKATRQAIHDEICEKGFNPQLNSFTQRYGSDLLDSSLLLMYEVGFLPITDPRLQGTIAAIEQHLMRDGFLLRYDSSKSSDGLPSGEGAFIACSFWLVGCLNAIGREEDARKLFERLLSLSNDLGLLSEEYDPAKKRLVGNFPQAFSHIALVNAAFQLADGEAVRQRDPMAKQVQF
ncbi:glycoside hydrolase family 15 protein [Acidipila rosea]|uniref:GH15 family glucan-1,4-alpha-glucosidase n=1 Tax=Acidipila rosea TaxID=768535 RepID=A0A4R1KWP9_9BACT|nr:glycoside hydrolase family 15 protein [Acidipila rosea]TCK69736.1 GH15 family glucan-1,4-alpha-glucosidase [Acidipila rosea]